MEKCKVSLKGSWEKGWFQGAELILLEIWVKGNNFEPQTLYLFKPPFKMDIGIFSDKPKKKKSESQIPAEKYLRDVS